MSVASKNPFAALADDDSSSAPAPAKTAAPAETPASKPQPKKTGPASRGGTYYKRGGAPKPPAQKEEVNATVETGRFDRTENRPDRGRGRGRGRGGRGRGGGEGRGRQFDRHSATGLTDSDKKIGNSWGGANNEFTNENLGEADAAADAAAAPTEGGWGAEASADWGAPAADDAPGATDAAPAQERKPRQEEEEDNTLTLDEYLAKKTDGALSALVPKLDSRKTNEEDASLWKDAIKVDKSGEEESYFAGKTKAAPKPRAKKEEKQVIEIDARFPAPERFRGGPRGRGGNGRGRGARREGGEQRRNGGPREVDVDDQSAFPALS